MSRPETTGAAGLVPVRHYGSAEAILAEARRIAAKRLADDLVRRARKLAALRPPLEPAEPAEVPPEPAEVPAAEVGMPDLVQAYEAVLERDEAPGTADLLARYRLAAERWPGMRGPRGRALIAMVAGVFDVQIRDMSSVRRTWRLAAARHVAMWLLRRDSALSLPQIGQLLGGRDHTTVIHGCRRIDAVLAAAGTSLADCTADVAALRLRAMMEEGR